MSAEPSPSGTKEDPLLVTQSYYKGCHHTVFSPQLKQGQFYQVTFHLDIGGRCPTCSEERAAVKAGKETQVPGSGTPMVQSAHSTGVPGASIERENLNAEITKPCPDCGHRLVMRVNRATNERFLGCSQYPQCTHHEPLTEYLRLRLAGVEPLF